MGDTDTTAPQEGAVDQPVDTDGDTQTGDSTPETPQVDARTEKLIADLRKENGSWRTKLRATEAQLNDIRQTVGDDPAAAIAQAREEARREAFTEALAVANDRIVRAEVMALAAGKLADPQDAVRMLDLDQYEVNENGEVDRQAIAAAVDELVKAKPYLAGARDPEFGARNGATPALNGDPLLRAITSKLGL